MNKKSSLLLHDEAESIYAHVDEEINNNPECRTRIREPKARTRNDGAART